MGGYNNSVNATPGRNINTSLKFAFNRVNLYFPIVYDEKFTEAL